MFEEAEVQSDDGSWYLMRIMPYRTTENVIDGLVITFVNVSKVRNLQVQSDRILGTLTRAVHGVRAESRFEVRLGLR